jgi:hypothetical protein
VHPQHRVRTFETNGACTGYTTNVFADRVTISMTGEAMNRGARPHFGPVMILIHTGYNPRDSTNQPKNVEIGQGQEIIATLSKPFGKWPSQPTTQH